MKIATFTLGVIACLFGRRALKAAVMTYTNQAAWSLAGGPSTVEDFSGATVGTSTSGFGPTLFNGFSLSAVSNGDAVGVATGTIANGGDNFPIPGSFTGQNFFGWGNVNGSVGPTTTITFNSPVTAFGFDWFNTDFSDQYDITLNPGGETFGGPPFSVGGNSGFFGVVSDTPISSATIATQFQGGYVSTEGFDNVRVASASTPVPEPASLLVWGLIGGVSALGYRLRRRQSSV